MRSPRLFLHHAKMALAAVTLILPAAFPAAAEESLGRLFFSPEKRQALDRQRMLNIQERQQIPEEPTLTLNGMVRRSSGKHTAWINNVPVQEDDRQSGITVTPSQRHQAQVIVQSAELPAGNVRIGDTVNRNTGETSDLLGEGTIRIHRAPPSSARPSGLPR